MATSHYREKCLWARKTCARITGVSKEKQAFNSATDVGYISQNVYLFYASEALATVVRGLLDRKKLHELLNLKTSQHVILGQSVGYPKP